MPRPRLTRVNQAVPQTVGPLGRALAAAFTEGDFLSDGLAHSVSSDTAQQDKWTAARLEYKTAQAILELEAWVAIPADAPFPDDEVFPGAVMLLAPPGVEAGDGNAKNAWYAAYKEATPAETQKIYDQLLTELADLENAAVPGGAKATYHIDFIGTPPVARKQGLASALLRHVLDRADRDKVIATLVTQTAGNEAYYTRFGFKTQLQRQLTVNGETGTIWYMVYTPGTQPSYPKDEEEEEDDDDAEAQAFVARTGTVGHDHGHDHDHSHGGGCC
ncbi:hypothetical protein Q8F55_003385 [Vanrija albida]|uniref:N-acetyltransferase domain-containing protein n=1 Tax=Vanrija albida TaxID=181172 RepID=A0ABR3Q4M6_9TREE